jgi:hypothetical protein
MPRFTGARKPFNAPTMMLIVGFVAPAITVMLAADVVSVKSPVTVRFTGGAYTTELEEVPLKRTA